MIKLIKTDVDELKTDLDDITFVAKPKNLFNWDTISDGKYINPSSGNLNSHNEYWTSDFIEVEAERTLYVSKSEVETYLFYVVAYDLNKTIIGTSSENVFKYKIPIGGKYVRVCSIKSNIPINSELQIEYDAYTAYEPHFVPYRRIKKFGYITVGKKDCDYITLIEAVNNASDGDIIFVHNGIYDNEEVSAFDKTLTIVGETKNGVIIKNGLNTYSRPPLEFSSGCVKNITFDSYGTGNSLDDTGYKAYGVHIDNTHSIGKTLLFENCIFKSKGNAGVGLGLWKDETIEFNNCDFEGVGNKGGLYCHDNVYEGNTGDGKLLMRNCRFKGTQFGLQLQSYNVSGNNITVEFICCSCNPRPVFVTTKGEVSTVSALENWSVSPLAFGNQYSTLNT